MSTNDTGSAQRGIDSRNRFAWGRVPALLVAGALALNLISPAKGEDDLTDKSLEELMQIEVPKVVGVSKFEQKTTEAPSSVTVVTAEEIRRYGYRTLADILQSVQGFHVSYDRNYAFLGARGVNLGDFNSRILLLVNGHRVNNNLTDGAFIDTAFILGIDLIERVEIIRGPGSVLYGNNAFFGVINVITRSGKQLNGMEVSGEYGSFDAYKGRATFGRQFTNGLQLLVSGTYFDNSGPDRLFYKEFNTPANNNGVAHDLDSDWAASMFASVSYADFTLEGAYNRREKLNPTGTFSDTNNLFFTTTFNDDRFKTIDQRAYTSLKYAHVFPDIVDLTAQVYYDRYDFEIGYPFRVLDSSGTTVSATAFSREQDIGEWWGAEVQLNKRLWDRHIVTLGAEYRDDFHQEYGVSGQSPVQGDRQSYGVYAQGDFAVLTNLHLNGGVRYDKYGDFNASFNPRLAAIYHPVQSSTIKALYGTAFRAPNFLELIDSRFPDLQPEEITSYELVYEQDIGRHFRSSVAGFYNVMDDLVAYNNGVFANMDAETKGAEIALNGFWTNGLRGRLSYSYQETRNHSVGWEMPDSPMHQLKLNLSVPLYRDKVFGSVELQYLSSRRTLHNIAGGQIIVQGEDTGGYATVNLTLYTQNLIKNLDFSVSVYNIFDNRYSDPSTRYHIQDSLERDGRTFRLKLTYRF